jgi:heterotetrameric sarcosine oxidase delta subunit
VSLLVACPTCGERPVAEFSFGGELRDVSSPDPEADFARVYLRENIAGVQEERWFHLLGCRRWVTLRRDTVVNRFAKE